MWPPPDDLLLHEATLGLEILEGGADEELVAAVQHFRLLNQYNSGRVSFGWRQNVCPVPNRNPSSTGVLHQAKPRQRLRCRGFDLCARHGLRLGGESPLGSWS